MNELCNQDDLMKKLKIKSRNTLYLWRKRGMPVIKQGRSIRFDYPDVLNWLKNK